MSGRRAAIYFGGRPAPHIMDEAFIPPARESSRLADEVSRLAKARAARQRAAMQRELEADTPDPGEPREPPSVQLFAAIITHSDLSDSYHRVNMANRFRYLEKAMGYASEGLLWYTVAATAPRKLGVGGTEYTLRFPRPAYLDDNLPWTRDGKALPPGHYDGAITLTLSNPDWAPNRGRETPAFTFRKLPSACTVTLVIESLRPIHVPPGLSGLSLAWAQLQQAFRDVFFQPGEPLLQ